MRYNNRILFMTGIDAIKEVVKFYTISQSGGATTLLLGNHSISRQWTLFVIVGEDSMLLLVSEQSVALGASLNNGQASGEQNDP